MSVFILDLLPLFDEYMKSQTLLHSSIILQRLVIRSPKLAEELLHQQVTSNHINDEASQPFLAFDFSIFKACGPWSAFKSGSKE